MAKTGNQNDPLMNFIFEVEIDGLNSLGFCHVDGLASQINIHADIKDSARRVEYSNIILRRGFDQSQELWEWYKSVVNGRFRKRDGRIIIFDQDRRPSMAYRFRNAWPCRWELSPLDALHPNILIEEVELVIDSFDINI